MMKKSDRSNVYELYLRDLGVIVKEMAFAAAADHRQYNDEFRAGYLSGFHRIVSLMQQQTIGFNIPLDKIGLDGIDSDVDLI